MLFSKIRMQIHLKLFSLLINLCNALNKSWLIRQLHSSYLNHVTRISFCWCRFLRIRVCKHCKRYFVYFLLLSYLPGSKCKQMGKIEEKNKMKNCGKDKRLHVKTDTVSNFHCCFTTEPNIDTLP